MDKRYFFNFQFLKYFISISSCFFKSYDACALFFLLLILKLLYEFLVYQIGIITSGYYVILIQSDPSAFFIHTAESIVYIVSVSVVIASSSYVASVIHVLWRQRLTCHLHEHYFRNNKYYELNALDDSVDNPDQRIAQDVDNLCLNLSDILPTVLISPFKIVYYVYKCHAIAGWLGPGAVVVYFLLGTAFNKALISSVSHFIYLQEKLEGFFRFKHMHIRMNAEAVAFQCGQQVELANVNSKFCKLLDVQQKLFLRQLPLNMLVQLFSYFGSILSFLILAGPIFSGQYGELNTSELSGLISKNAFVTIYLINCFSNLVGLAEPVATVVGTTHRISQLRHALLGSDTPSDLLPVEAQDHWKILDAASGKLASVLIINNLSLQTPTGQKLAQDLTFQVSRGQSLLVIGPSGCGKSALLRTLRGLWQPCPGGTFQITPSRVHFFPQKPVLTDGSLRQQVAYPNAAATQGDDAKLHRLFEVSGLSSLVSRADGLDTAVDFDWYNCLSPGETQRLCFIRLLCQVPVLAFLDESLSSVSVQLEETLYQEALGLGITLVSVGHRPTLQRFHQQQLQIHNDGSWTLQPLR